jgi:Caspase domain
MTICGRPLACSTALLVVALATAPAGSVPQDQANRGLRKVEVPLGPEKTPTQLYKASYALVIGISQYTRGWPTLPGVVEDVTAVADALRRHGFEVTLARDVTREGFDRALRDFISTRGLDPEHRLLIYFAGHGETVGLPDGRQLGYLVPADAPEQRADPVKFDELAISMDLIEAYARRIRAKHALFVFDSCFSGSLFTALRGLPPAISERIRQPVRQFITAGSATQQVPDRSQFRRSFIEALNGDADGDRDGFVTGSELGYWLEQQVTNYSRGAQTPQSGKIRDAALDKGDIVFAVGPPSAPAAPARPAGAPVESGGDLAPREELAFWESIKDAKDRRGLELYLEKYGPGARFRDVAKLKLLEFDRQDPERMARRFLEALQAGDVELAWDLASPVVRQNFNATSFAAYLKPHLRTSPGERTLVSFSQGTQGATAVFRTGDHFERVGVLNANGWGIFSFAIRAKEAPPAVSAAALKMVTALYRGRWQEAYSQLAAPVRAQVTMDVFQKLFAGAPGLGEPVSRALLYSEYDTTTNPAVPFGWVVHRNRYPNGTELFEGVSVAVGAVSGVLEVTWGPVR